MLSREGEGQNDGNFLYQTTEYDFEIFSGDQLPGSHLPGGRPGIVLSLIVGLKLVRMRCFPRIRFEVSPISAMYGKITLHVSSGDLLCFFFFFFWIMHLR